VVDVELVSVEGRRLHLSQASTSSDEGLWSFTAELTGETYQASVAVWELGDGLATYFDQLASRWRGFDGPLTYTSLEQALALDATHDGLGTVTMKVTLYQPWPSTWSVQAELGFEAGAQLDAAAADVRTLVDVGLQR
jgi:hypothetical protein